METYYKIRNKTLGLFSTGGSVQPCFSKTGKTWNSLRDVNLHFSQFERMPRAYLDCELVELTMVEASTKDVCDVFADRELKAARDKKARLEETTKAELAMLKQLKEKYPEEI